jgi:hypothetical protein
MKTAPLVEAVKTRLLSVDNNGSAIMVKISVVIAFVDHNGSVAVLMITVADDVTVPVPVTISVTLTNRYANRADTNAHFFGSSRHCTENSGDGDDRYGIFNHCVLLSLLKLWEGNAWAPGSFRVLPGAGCKQTGVALDATPMPYVRPYHSADGPAVEYQQQTAWRHLVPSQASPADSASRNK